MQGIARTEVGGEIYGIVAMFHLLFSIQHKIVMQLGKLFTR